MKDEKLAALREEWEQIEKEHAYLHTLFGALECAADRDSAIHAVADLEKWLERHFEREEKPGGVLEGLATPEESKPLLDQHRDLRAILLDTRQLLSVAADLESEMVREAVTQIGATLRSHERSETALIERWLARAGRAS